MSAKRMTAWVATVLLSSLVAESVLAGPIGVVDNYSAAGVAEYTLTRILDNGVAESNVSFSDATGALVASYGGTVNQAEQVVFLRNDKSLAIGEMLLVDVSSAVNASQMDFGLAVSATLTPTAASAGDTDTRDTFDWASISFRPSQDAIRVNRSIGGVVDTNTGTTGSIVETTVNRLFIERLSSTSFSVGFWANSIRTNVSTINFTATNVGTSIGYYADLRAVNGTLGSMDNLRIVPEPASWLMGILGLIGAAPLWKRRVRS